jgi:hypothetical protein
VHECTMDPRQRRLNNLLAASALRGFGG